MNRFNKKKGFPKSLTATGYFTEQLRLQFLKMKYL